MAVVERLHRDFEDRSLSPRDRVEAVVAERPSIRPRRASFQMVRTRMRGKEEEEEEESTGTAAVVVERRGRRRGDLVMGRRLRNLTG